MIMKKREIWDILVYVALAVLIIWVVLKLSGVINTPVLVEIIPYISGGYILGRMFQKLETSVNEVKIIKSEVKIIDERLKTLEIKDHLKKVR